MEKIILWIKNNYKHIVTLIGAILAMFGINTLATEGTTSGTSDKYVYEVSFYWESPGGDRIYDSEKIVSKRELSEEELTTRVEDNEAPGEEYEFGGVQNISGIPPNKE